MQRRRRWQYLFVLVSGCLVGVLLLWGLAPRRASPSGQTDLSLLISALGPVRPIEARLSGGFRFGRVAPTPADPDIALAIARLEHAGVTQPSWATRRAAAVAMLVDGRVEHATRALERLTSEDGGRADAWSDLAAAYLARGRPDDFSGAVEAATRAVAADPQLPEALYNRALALERLHLSAQARDAWQAALAIEQSHEWAEEMRTHVRALDQQLARRAWAASKARLAPDGPATLTAGEIAEAVDRFPRESREYVEEDLLVSWARTIQKDATVQAGHGSIQIRAEQIAERLAQRGDSLPLESVRALAATPARLRPVVAAGHIRYAEGRAAYERYAFAEADRLLKDAQHALEGRSPLVHWVRFYRAIVVYQQNDLSGAHARLEALRPIARARHYRALLGRIEWVEGVIEGARGHFALALDAYARASTHFEQLGDVESVATLQALSAEALRVMGNVREGWTRLMSALARLSELDRPQRRQAITMSGALACLRQERYHAALALLDEFLAAARQIGSSTAIAEAHVQRARVYRRTRDERRMHQELAEAKSWLSKATERGLAAFLEAQVALLEGELLTTSDATLAYERLTSALGYFQRTERAGSLPRVYLARARLLREQGRKTEAEADLSVGMALFEDQRRRLTAEAMRLTYQDDLWTLFEDSMLLNIERGSLDAAFAHAERSRARSIVEARDLREARPLTPDEIAAAMTDDAAMLYYVFARDQAFLWCIAKGSVTLRPLRATRAALTDAARQLREAIDLADAPLIDKTAAALSAQVIPADLAVLRSAGTWIVVPDGPLHGVPFALLPEPGVGTPAIDRHAVIVAASARIYVTRDRAPRDAIRRGPALIVAAPAGSGALTVLPEARQEGRQVAAMYPLSTLLMGVDATATRVRGALPNARIIHLATHAIVNGEYPDLSQFVLAPETAGAGASLLTARDLADLDFDRAELVVLAACDTASGPAYAGEGVVSLARPFLMRGARSVVGTLWPLDDRTAHVVFAAFHRLIVDGATLSEALRQAQMAARRDPSLPPAAWAAPILLGRIGS